jgi:hypothetical protein
MKLASLNPQEFSHLNLTRISRKVPHWHIWSSKILISRPNSVLLMMTPMISMVPSPRQTMMTTKPNPAWIVLPIWVWNSATRRRRPREKIRKWWLSQITVSNFHSTNSNKMRKRTSFRSKRALRGRTRPRCQGCQGMLLLATKLKDRKGAPLITGQANLLWRNRDRLAFYPLLKDLDKMSKGRKGTLESSGNLARSLRSQSNLLLRRKPSLRSNLPKILREGAWWPLLTLSRNYCWALLLR